MLLSSQFSGVSRFNRITPSADAQCPSLCGPCYFPSASSCCAYLRARYTKTTKQLEHRRRSTETFRRGRRLIRKPLWVLYIARQVILSADAQRRIVAASHAYHTPKSVIDKLIDTLRAAFIPDHSRRASYDQVSGEIPSHRHDDAN